jgi:membrane protease YdiL (CAAX protease family)
LVAILIAFMVAANALLWLVSTLVPTFDANQAQENEFIGAAGAHPSLALVALVLMPPILEETIFRGFMFPALAKRVGVMGGAILSSILFGIAHWQANIGIYTFVLGLLLCFMYVRLRSIVPGILLHMLNNYLALIALTTK